MLYSMIKLLKTYSIVPLITITSCCQITPYFDGYENVRPVRIESSAVLEGWKNYYFSKEDCQCVYGDEFFISIEETTLQTGNLMISLQGGGACWPGKVRCKPTVTPEDVQTSAFTTALKEALPDDWNQVVIPYCDGSVYMGDNKLDYDGDQETDHWHNGLRNSKAALTLTKEKFPNLSKIFLTGCSAGGYGTIIQLRLLRQLYPDANIYVLNESGPGLMRPDTDYWNLIDSSWNLSDIMPEGCSTCKGQLIYWYKELLKDPKVKIGLYSAYRDHIIGESFLEMDPADFEALLLKHSGELNNKYPDQFKRYFIKGNSHCIDDRSYVVKGVKYWDWVLAFLTDSENWQDVLE